MDQNKKTTDLVPQTSNNSVIGSKDLKTNPTLTLPEQKVDVQPAPVTLPEVTTPAQAEQAKLAAQKTSDLSSIQQMVTDIAGVQGKEAGYATAAGADTAQKEYDRFASELAAEQRGNEIQKRNLALRGGSKEQLANEYSALDRESLQKQADIAIKANFAKGRFDTALSIAQRKIESEVAPLKAKLDGLKFVYDNNKDLYTKAELSKLDGMIKKDEAAIEEQKKTRENVSNLALQLATNQAPESVTTKALAAKNINELMAIPGVGKYLQSPLERMKLQQASLDIKKATQDLKDTMSLSAGNGLTDKQRTEVLKNPIATKAASRIGVISAIEKYKNLAADYYGTGTFGLIKPSRKAELDAMLNTTVGSAINVAQGQGAMGDEEAKRILGGLKITNTTSPRRIQSSADGIISAQDTLYQNDLGFVESAIPGASTGYQLFADYQKSKTDPLLISSSQYGENRLNLD